MAGNPNPFHWEGTVKDSDAFIGRKREREAIYRRLGHLGCTSVVGPRRIGKSSLLYQAHGRLPVAALFQYRLAYLDMQSAAHHTLEGLLTAIAAGFGRNLTLAAALSPPQMLAAFERVVRNIRGDGLAPVLFIDELEYLAGRMPVYGDNVLESWRSLCDDGQMAVVTASRSPLVSIARDKGWTSPFYNLFEQVDLREFTEAEASEFGKWAQRVGQFDGSQAAFVLREGKTHPFRLMLTAYYLLEAKQRGEVDYEAIKQQVKDRMATALGQG